jgi:hypothetical protein
MTISKRPVRRRGRRERGAILGIVLVLVAVLLGASVYAIYSMRSDTGASGQERTARQLFDCAEQGLAFAKQYFSTVQRNNWDAYLATDVCASDATLCAPYGPFPTGNAGTAPTGYPTLAPYTQTIQIATASGSVSYQYTVGIYNNPEPAPGTAAHDNDNTIVVFSRCSELVGTATTGQNRSVQAIINVPQQFNDDYTAQAGRGFRNQGNANY